MKGKSSFRILIVDDNPDIHEDFRKILAADDRAERNLAEVEAKLLGRPVQAAEMPSFELDYSSQGQEGLQWVIRARDVGRPYALAFVDIRMPVGWDGIETIEHLWKADPALEVVICTAFSDYSADEIVRRLRRSHQLLLLKKPFDNIEVRLLAIALTEKWRLAREAQSYFHDLEALVKSRTQELEQSLSLAKASENQHRLLFDSNPTPIYTFHQETLSFLAVNEAAVAHYGYSKDEFLKMTLRDIALPDEIPAFLERLANATPGAGNAGVWRHRTRGGKLTNMEITSHSLRTQKMWLCLAMDVTERLSLEAQLRQSQKMESVGQLAGGIAHDFNNLLTVINGHVGLIMADENINPAALESLKEIAEAGKRANTLTRQLMTFSRKQEFYPQVVDLNEVVNNITKMLRRILGEDVHLEVEFAPGLPSIKADLGMMEQVLLNLAVNSRDAMPRGGKLRIVTTTVTLDTAHALHNPESAAGVFARLTFSDSGCGIPPEIVGRIFEPFFTTKELDRGTGLGLATVYGIVKQHHGWIEVSSRVGEGSTFQIFFPACPDRRGSAQLGGTEAQVMGGTETILVVEDEAPLLKLIHHVLESYGYKVLDSSNGREALEIWEQQRHKIDMLLTDLILPDGMAGPELAGILQTAKPRLKVLYTSGYDQARLAKEFPEGARVNFIQKPFHARKLAESVFACLNDS